MARIIHNKFSPQRTKRIWREAKNKLYYNITPAVTGAFVVSAANEKCVRVYDFVMHFLLSDTLILATSTAIQPGL